METVSGTLCLISCFALVDSRLKTIQSRQPLPTDHLLVSEELRVASQTRLLFGPVDTDAEAIGQQNDLLEAAFSKDAGLPHRLSNTIREHIRVRPCNVSHLYRTLTGECNNIRGGRRYFGSRLSQQTRLLRANYDDNNGLGFRPRLMGADRKERLPSPRLVSTTVFVDGSARTQLPNLIFQWGQFVDHDITLTPTHSRSEYGSVLSCTSCNSANSESSKCAPIRIPDNDKVFPKGTCMPFVRSINAQTTDGPRETLNQLTSFIDASNVYGTNETTLQTELREKGTFSGGKLKLQPNGLLPVNKKKTGCVGGTPCLQTGEVRSNIVASLLSMHTLWVHEHNRIADDLAKLNSHWNSDKIFEETRKVIGAMMQHITYNEFLPVVIGTEKMQHFGMELLQHGFSTDYDDECNPSIFTEFSTAAFRFGHSLVSTKFQLGRGDNTPIYDSDGKFFDPNFINVNPQNWKSLLLGLTEQKCEKADELVDSALHHRLFAKSPKHRGLDLIALNIQRGRDHGLSFYRDYRKHFNITVPNNWNDLRGIMSESAQLALQRTYKKIGDIELFPGILSEIPADGALLGELGGLLIGEQFRRLKKCDRFWYESENYPSQYPKWQRLKQLEELRRVSLRGVLCGVLGGEEGMKDYCPKNTGYNVVGPTLDISGRPIDVFFWQEDHYG